MELNLSEWKKAPDFSSAEIADRYVMISPETIRCSKIGCPGQLVYFRQKPLLPQGFKHFDTSSLILFS
jgi:hypothetical protein